MSEGKYHEAIDHYKAALRYAPADAGIYVRLGLAYWKSGVTALALDFLYQGVLLNLRLGHRTEAIRIADQMKEIDPSARYTLKVQQLVEAMLNAQKAV